MCPPSLSFCTVILKCIQVQLRANKLFEIDKINKCTYKTSIDFMYLSTVSSSSLLKLSSTKFGIAL